MTPNEAASELARVREMISDLTAKKKALESYLLKDIDEGQEVSNGRLKLTWTARRDRSDIAAMRLQMMAEDKGVPLHRLGHVKFVPSSKLLEAAVHGGDISREDLDKACPISLYPRWTIHS